MSLFLFILCLLVGVVGVVLLVMVKGRTGRIGGAVAVGLSLLLVVACSTVHVGSREVGVVTTFSRYDHTEGPGWHLTTPWSSVDKFTTRIQTLEQRKIKVTLRSESQGAPGATAEVSVTVRWYIADAGETGDSTAKDLWFKYQSFDNVRDMLVTAETQTSTREAMGDYTPRDAKAGQNVRKLGAAVASNLTRALADDGVVVDSVNVTDVDLADDVERRLRDAVAAEGKLATDRVELERAKVQAEINKTRQLNMTPQTITQNCFDLVRFAIENKVTLPATFDCGMSRGGTDVLIGAK